MEKLKNSKKIRLELKSVDLDDQLAFTEVMAEGFADAAAAALQPKTARQTWCG